MIVFFAQWRDLTWHMLTESALFLFIGFFLAGIIRAIITPTAMSSLFGKSSFAQVFRASLLGIPLPLCSCSVLPVAAQLRKSGLTREGTVSFLISTPETGPDSIALSFKLLGPVFAVLRPVTALIVAFSSGIVSMILKNNSSGKTISLDAAPQKTLNEPLSRRLIAGQKYLLTNVIPELSYYLFWGYVLAGLAAALIPADFVRTGLSGWMQYMAVIVVSLPIYVCAASSTPLAAVLLTIGITPGAVLVFLLVGPATNLTALVVQKQILGLRGTLIMTASVIFFSIICGLGADLFFGSTNWVPFQITDGALQHKTAELYDLIAGYALIVIMSFYTIRHYYRKFNKTKTVR